MKDMPPGDQQLWLLALSGPLVALNRKAGARYDVPSFWAADAGTEQGDLLSSAWGIEDREGLLETVSHMADRGHAVSIGANYWAWHQVLPSDRESARAEMPELNRLRDLFLDRTALLTGPGGIRAWDLGRMSYLLRNGLYLGYISEQECQYLHLQLGYRALYWYRSWDQYLCGYFSGRMLWMALEIESPDELKAFLFDEAPPWLSRIFNEVLTDPDNPATYLPWAMALDQIERPNSLGEEGL
jgi:hypothetical protein